MSKVKADKKTIKIKGVELDIPKPVQPYIDNWEAYDVSTDGGLAKAVCELENENEHTAVLYVKAKRKQYWTGAQMALYIEAIHNLHGYSTEGVCDLRLELSQMID